MRENSAWTSMPLLAINKVVVGTLSNVFCDNTRMRSAGIFWKVSKTRDYIIGNSNVDDP